MFTIPKLNILTIPYIKKLANECNIELNNGKKSDLIEQIVNSNISEEKLNSLIEKYLKEKNQNIGYNKRKSSNYLTLETRVKKLEDQINYIYSSLHINKEISILKEDIDSKNQYKEGNLLFIGKNIETLEDIKEFIVTILELGDSITIDNLIKIKELQTISLSLLKKAVSELIENNVLYPSKEESIQKINGNIGKLRRIN